MSPRLRHILSTIAGMAMLLTIPAGCSSPTEDSTTPVSEDSNKVLLVVSFGTSYDDNRDLSVGGVENALATAFPEYEIRRAFTSQIIIDVLAGRGTDIDNVTEAMERLVADGVTDLMIQPTTIMKGFEYTDMVNEVMPYKDKFDSFVVGEPLLSEEKDFDAVVASLISQSSSYVSDTTAVVYMGHGTHHDANSVYAQLQDMLNAQTKNIFIGTVEASPTLDDVMTAAQAAGVSKVVLKPLMLVAGDHANNDMAGDEPDSWKSQFEAAGFEVETIIEGLGQLADIQQIYVEHARTAVETGSVPTLDSTASPSTSITADQVADGTYPITATTDSSMFNVVDVQLTAANGAMEATITLSSDGYGRLFLGTADEASQATEGHIAFTTDTENRHVYVVPIEALNETLDVATESGETPDKWYDHTIVFHSDAIPSEAITN